MIKRESARGNEVSSSDFHRGLPVVHDDGGILGSGRHAERLHGHLFLPLAELDDAVHPLARQVGRVFVVVHRGRRFSRLARLRRRAPVDLEPRFLREEFRFNFKQYEHADNRSELSLSLGL